MTILKRWCCSFVFTIISTIGLQAQQIQVVDANGTGIALACITTQEGVLIGMTDIDGKINDTKGATEVIVSHVAYKPVTVNISKLSNGQITLEENDYTLTEITVKPKPFIYVEDYYRVFIYTNDSLRYYRAGILINAHDVKKNKTELGGIWAYGSFSKRGKGWMAARTERLVKRCAKVRNSSTVDALNKGKWHEYYRTKTEPVGKNRLRVYNPEQTLGYISYTNGQSRLTINAGETQMYANKVNNEKKTLKKRQELGYKYQYTEIYRYEEGEEYGMEDFIMNTNRWTLNTKNGHEEIVIEVYATNHGYMTKEEFKKRKKEVNQDYAGDMPLSDLEAYEKAHHVPSLASEMRQLIKKMNEKKSKK